MDTLRIAELFVDVDMAMDRTADEVWRSNTHYHAISFVLVFSIAPWIFITR